MSVQCCTQIMTDMLMICAGAVSGHLCIYGSQYEPSSEQHPQNLVSAAQNIAKSGFAQ